MQKAWSQDQTAFSAVVSFQTAPELPSFKFREIYRRMVSVSARIAGKPL
jgi:hypothetical protein